MVRTGIEVLSHGLPELPDQMSYLMAIPVAHWTAKHCAVVLFLQFHRHGRQHDPGALMVPYARADTGWERGAATFWAPGSATTPSPCPAAAETYAAPRW